MASFLPSGYGQLAELLVRPVVNHVVTNQRDVFKIMEELLSEKHGLPEENGAGEFQYEICDECGKPE
jgi:hypothetical protein